jgi:hypothetical protein
MKLAKFWTKYTAATNTKTVHYQSPPNPIYNMKSVTEIPTEKGALRIWEDRPGHWSFATPNGSQGSDEPDFDSAKLAAADAEKTERKL